MIPDPVRWGVLGVARIAAQRTLPAMNETAWARPLAIASRDRARAAEAAAALGVERAYGDYQALLDDPEVEAVYIPLPNTLHVEWCEKALDAGKHVLCEKPLALRAAEVDRLIRARDRSGRQIEEAFSFRNHPQWERLDALLDQGAIGRPLAVQGMIAKRFLDPADIRNDPTLGGGALYDLGAYVLAACNGVFRRPPLRVAAVQAVDETFGVDGLTTAILDYGDAQASFTASSRGGTDAWATHQHFSVLGTEGWIRLDFPYAQARPTACNLFHGDLGSVGAFPTGTIAFDPVNQYAAQIERFSRLIRGESVRAWPIEDAKATLAVIEALFAAARDRTWRTL